MVGHLRGLVRREMLSQEATPFARSAASMDSSRAWCGRSRTARWRRPIGAACTLAAARYFETLDDEGIAGALAEHYVAAYRAQPEGPEGEAVAAQARVALRGAAERARSLGSFVQAMRFLEQALEVTTDPKEELALHVAAGDAALYAGLEQEPIAHTGRALEMARELGVDREEILDAVVRHAISFGINSRMAEDAELLEAAQAEFQDLEGTRGYVRLSAELARAYLLLTRGEDSTEHHGRDPADRRTVGAAPRDTRADHHPGSRVGGERSTPRGNRHANRGGRGGLGRRDPGRGAPGTRQPQLRGRR